MRLRPLALKILTAVAVVSAPPLAVLIAAYFWGLALVGPLPKPEHPPHSQLVRTTLWLQVEPSSTPKVRRLNPVAYVFLFTCYGRQHWRDCQAEYPGHTLAGVVAREFVPSPLPTIRRHTAHVALLIWLSRNWTPNQLLDAAASDLYFGRDAVGVEEGAREFFGSTSLTLQPHQIALLAWFSQAPARRVKEASCHPEAATRGRNELLARLGRSGLMSATQTNAAMAQPLGARLPQIDCERLRPDA